MIIFFVSLFSISIPAFADTVDTEIVKIERGSTPQEESLLYLSNGSVGFLAPSEASGLAAFQKSAQLHEKYRIELGANHQVLSYQKIGKSTLPQASTDLEMVTQPYTPTLLSSLAQADQIFQNMNQRFRKKSECYNRAEVWTYEAFKETGTLSMKVFLFFTSKYIREYRYGWWFHVSPYAMVSENNQAIERVLDRAYFESPALMKDWTDYFIEPKTICPVVAKYSDYSNHQSESYCYLIKVPMYFWQPRDIEELEKSGVEKTEFIQSDLDWAYRQAFK